MGKGTKMTKMKLRPEPLAAAAPDLYRMTELLERFLVYEIRRSDLDGDDEGANLKSFTLQEVRCVLAKARGETL